MRRSTPRRHALHRAAIETLESRQMLTVTIPTNAVPVGTPVVASGKGPTGPAYTTAPVYTQALDAGATYLLVASNAHQIANSPYRYADAQYWQQTAGQSVWTASSGTHLNATGVTRWKGASLDASDNLVWADAYQFDHIYAATVVGTGDPLAVRVTDTDYKDNAGSISLQVYKLLPTVSINADDAAAAEDAQDPATFTVARTGAGQTSAALTVYFRFDTTGDHAATTPAYDSSGDLTNGDDADFTVSSNVTPVAGDPGLFAVTIPQGQPSTQFSVTPLNDSLVEGTESVTPTLVSDVDAATPAYAAPDANLPGNPFLAAADITDLIISTAFVDPEAPTSADMQGWIDTFLNANSTQAQKDRAVADLSNAKALHPYAVETFLDPKFTAAQQANNNPALISLLQTVLGPIKITVQSATNTLHPLSSAGRREIQRRRQQIRPDGTLRDRRDPRR